MLLCTSRGLIFIKPLHVCNMYWWYHVRALPREGVGR